MKTEKRKTEKSVDHCVLTGFAIAEIIDSLDQRSFCVDADALMMLIPMIERIDEKSKDKEKKS